MTTVGPDAGAAATAVRPVAPWRQVAIPTEHGGWSLTAEPVVLGLLVAWSWPGAALGVAAMLAFVARTPVKLVLVDRWRHRWLDRSRLALRIAAVEIALIVVLGVVAAATSANGWFWVPLAAAAPLVGIELWFDMRSRGRRLVPELAGTVGIGSVVAAIVLAADGSVALAVGLWVVVSARACAAIPYARTQVFRESWAGAHQFTLIELEVEGAPRAAGLDGGFAQHVGFERVLNFGRHREREHRVGAAFKPRHARASYKAGQI